MEANALSEALSFTWAAFSCASSSSVALCFFVDLLQAQCLYLVCWSCWSPVFVFVPCLLKLLKPSVFLSALFVDVVEAQYLTLCLVSLLMLRPCVPHCAMFRCWCWGPVFHIVPSFFVNVEALCSTLYQVSLLVLRPCVTHCAEFLCWCCWGFNLRVYSVVCLFWECRNLM